MIDARVMDEYYKKCDLCHISTRVDETPLFGEWMKYQNIQVHYFCLLLSTNLPQNGPDISGILGFLLRDIRNEIKAAAKRTCCYCNNTHASIGCANCHEYFHLVCGKRENCLFQFQGEFLSYCDKCVSTVLTPFQQQLVDNPPSAQTRCTICHEEMHKYNPTRWIYGSCCGIGFCHRYCMLVYALHAGYYLRCIWCRGEKFRTLVPLQGIFVPDRDAIWEREPGAYSDLHRRNPKCNMSQCLCPRGSDFISQKWPLANCVLCGSFGAHNPYCITGNLKSKTPVDNFKCEVCSNTQKSTASEKASSEEKEEQEVIDDVAPLDLSLFLQKKSNQAEQEPSQHTIEFSPVIDSQRSNSATGSDNNRNTPNNPNSDAKEIVEDPMLEQTNDIDRALQQWIQLEDKTDASWTAVPAYQFSRINNILQCTDSMTLLLNLKDNDSSKEAVAFDSSNILSTSKDTNIFRMIDDIIDKFNKEHNQ